MDEIYDISFLFDVNNPFLSNNIVDFSSGCIGIADNNVINDEDLFTVLKCSSTVQDCLSTAGTIGESIYIFRIRYVPDKYHAKYIRMLERFKYLAENNEEFSDVQKIRPRLIICRRFNNYLVVGDALDDLGITYKSDCYSEEYLKKIITLLDKRSKYRGQFRYW